MKFRVIQTSLLSKIGSILIPSLDSKFEKSRILCNGICPENTLNIYYESVHSKFLDRIREIVLFQRFRNTRITCDFIISLHSSEEYSERPSH